ncbi:MAG: hypothetical protein M3P93_10280 [Actinomycetota bacterium]|nr:hypothetical protein [Actinomycetota bacterium]
MGRLGVRGGRATRGFPPGSAQALVAVVLGAVAAVTGVRRGETVLAGVFAAVTVLGLAQLLRLAVRRRGGR